MIGESLTRFSHRFAAAQLGPAAAPDILCRPLMSNPSNTHRWLLAVVVFVVITPSQLKGGGRTGLDTAVFWRTRPRIGPASRNSNVEHYSNNVAQKTKPTTSERPRGSLRFPRDSLATIGTPLCPFTYSGGATFR
ncbi:hypothetical protein LX36DRAFT_54889 [Colletotrichum falcatum]|nr:hypothetical protein LX36DRAFT_54889 [Colletotrichum falcatum]